MTTEHKILMAPATPNSSPESKPAPEGPAPTAENMGPEKTPAVLEMEAWYRKFTAREDVREIMARLAK